MRHHHLSAAAGVATLALAATLAAGAIARPAGTQEAVNMNTRFMARAAQSAINIGLDLGIGYIPARIRAGNMTFFYDPAHPESASVTAMLDARTLETGQEEANGALLSADWLDADNHTHILFQSTGVETVSEGTYLKGDLTIKGQTHEVKVWVDRISDVLRDPGSKLDMVRFDGHAVIDRRDFDLGSAPMWNQAVIGELPRIGYEIRLDVHVTGYSFTGEHLQQMFRQPMEDGSPHPVGLIYDAVASAGVLAGMTEYLQQQAAHPQQVDHLTLSNAAWYLMLTGRVDDAIALFQASIDEKPDEWMTYLRQGDAYVFAGRYDEAIHNYMSMQEHYPTLPHIPEMLRLLGVEGPAGRR